MKIKYGKGDNLFPLYTDKQFGYGYEHRTLKIAESNKEKILFMAYCGAFGYYIVIIENLEY